MSLPGIAPCPTSPTTRCEARLQGEQIVERGSQGVVFGQVGRVEREAGGVGEASRRGQESGVQAVGELSRSAAPCGTGRTPCADQSLSVRQSFRVSPRRSPATVAS